MNKGIDLLFVSGTLRLSGDGFENHTETGFGIAVVITQVQFKLGMSMAALANARWCLPLSNWRIRLVSVTGIQLISNLLLKLWAG